MCIRDRATPAAPNQAPAVTQAAPPAPAAPETPTGPINRDSMTFGQAFADARKKGEKQFNWRGKPYAVKMAPPKPKDPTAKTKAALPNNMSYDQYQQSMNRSEEDPEQAASVTPAVDPNADARKNAGKPGYDEAGNPLPRSKVTAESVGYNELQRIVSLVNHR